jgi:hypothetical protein
LTLFDFLFRLLFIDFFSSSEEVKKAEIYTGELQLMKPPAKGEKVHQILREAVISLQNILAGYYCPTIKEDLDKVLKYRYDPGKFL